MLELVVEDLGLLSVHEVAVLEPPRGQRVGHPVGHLLQRPLALSGVQRPPEVLLGEDVGGVQAPELRHLDVELLEGHLAVPVVGDTGIAPLPAHLVVGMHAGGGEVTPDANTGSLGGDGHNGEVLLCGLSFGDSNAGPECLDRRLRLCHHPAFGGGSHSLTTRCSGCPAPGTRDAVFITAL